MDLCWKVTSLLFNALSRFVKAFLPRSKCLSILWLQSLPTENLEPRKIKSVTVSLVAQIVKHLSAMQETQVQSLGWEDPLEKEWQPTPVFLPGEFHGQRSLAGYSPWGHRELNTTEQTTQKRLFSSCSLSTIKVVSSTYLRLLTSFIGSSSNNCG